MVKGRKGFSVFPGRLTPHTKCRGKRIRPHSSVRPELGVIGAGGDAVTGGRCWVLKTLLLCRGESQDLTPKHMATWGFSEERAVTRSMM